MSRKTLAYGSEALFALLLVITLSLISSPAEARNPDLSYRTMNLSSSAAPDASTRPDFAPEIAVVGKTVHILWLTNDPADYKLYYRRSTDGGLTWEPKQLLFTKNDLITDNTCKRMTVVGNTVHIAVNYYLQGDTWYGVLGYFRSTNNGESFEPIRTLFSAAYAWHVYDLYVASSDGKVTIGFRNQCNWLVNNEYYVLNSDNGGDTFIQHTVYSTTTGSSWNVEDLQRIGDNIYVLYTNSYAYYGLQYSRLYLAASSNAGISFASTLISVPSLSGEDKTSTVQDQHYVPKMAGVGNQVSVIWAGLDADDVLSVFYRRSTDSGATFNAAQNLSRDVIPAGKGIQPGQETLAAQGDYVYSLFLSSAADVYLRRSTDSGASFLSLQQLGYNPGHYAHGVSLAGGWWPVIATDPTDATGAKVHASWVKPEYVYSTDGGATFTKPALVTPYFSYSGSSPTARPQMAIGPDGRPHFVMEACYYASSFGGYGDMDIFYRGLSPAPALSGSNNALRLVSNTADARYENLQVPANSYLRFTSQMTGEVWVRPSPGGDYTGWAGSYIKPIFHKNETDYSSYSLQTWARGSARQARVQIQTTAGAYAINPASASVGLVPDGVWSHLAFTYDAAGGDNNFKLYLNGQLVAQGTTTGNLATGDGLFFSGLYGVWDIAELRLWNRALSQTEIAACMYRPRKGDEPGLNAYYTFKDTTKDITGHGNDGILMYMEQFVQQNILRSDCGPAVDLLLLSE